MINNNQNYTCKCNCKRKHNCNYYTILKGYVCLDTGKTVTDAIVLLECLDGSNNVYNATTNEFGEFCFIVYNHIDYKLKIFKNDDACKLNLY